MTSSRFQLGSYGTFLLVLVLVSVPLFFLVLGSFSTARLPGDFSLSTMGLENYVKIYSDPGTWDIFVNTIIYVVGSVVIGISLAVALAWLVERTNMPGKIWIYAGVPMTLAVPGMLQAMAWVLLLSPRIGFINKSLQSLFGLTEAPINIYSLGGMIFIEGLRLVPTAFLMLVPLMRGMDPSLEEAAAVCGARPFSTARKITLRLLAPGLVAVMIYQAMTALEVFEIPGILGLPAGIYVFSTKIYAVIRSATFLPVYGQANALAIAFREIPDQAALHLVHAAEFHHRADFAGALAPCNALHFSDEVQVAADGHFPVQRYVLWQIADPLADFERLRKDIVASDHRVATTGRHKPRQDTHGGRFTGAVGSQETQNLPFFDAEGEIPDGCHGAVVFAEVIHLDHPVLSSCVPFNPLYLV
jgi:ABC-type sugar transport system permease subunit